MKGKSVAQLTCILILLAVLSLGVGASPGPTWTRASLIQPPTGVDLRNFHLIAFFSYLPVKDGQLDVLRLGSQYLQPPDPEMEASPGDFFL